MKTPSTPNLKPRPNIGRLALSLLLATSTPVNVGCSTQTTIKKQALKIKSDKRKMRELRGRLSDARDESERLKKELKESKEEAGKLNEKLGACEEYISINDTTLERMHKELEGVESELGPKKYELKAKNRELEKVERQIRAARRRLGLPEECEPTIQIQHHTETRIIERSVEEPTRGYNDMYIDGGSGSNNGVSCAGSCAIGG